MPTSTDTMLSKHFSLGDLVITTQTLSEPNLPSTQDQMNNLSVLAQNLDTLYDQIGPFQILSGFRTNELQVALGEGGAPTGPGTSFHEIGRAVDISPSNQTIQEFIGKLLANDAWRANFTEIIIKEPQNSIHLAVNTPDDTRTPKVLKLSSAGAYIRMPDIDLYKLIEPFLPDPEAREAAVKEIKASVSPGLIAAAIGAALIFLLRKNRS